MDQGRDSGQIQQEGSESQGSQENKKEDVRHTGGQCSHFSGEALGTGEEEAEQGQKRNWVYREHVGSSQEAEFEARNQWAVGARCNHCGETRAGDKPGHVFTNKASTLLGAVCVC